MTIERTFQRLPGQLRELEEALDALGTTVEQDKPAGENIIVAIRLNDAVLAAKGYLQESLGAATEAYVAVAASLDIRRAQRALAQCQERLHEFARYFATECVCFDRLDDVRSVGCERGRDWLNWSTVVIQELEQCRTLLEEARNAAFCCWQHLAERMASMPLVVRAEIDPGDLFWASPPGRRDQNMPRDPPDRGGI